jgi:hypothetical protein
VVGSPQRGLIFTAPGFDAPPADIHRNIVRFALLQN